MNPQNLKKLALTSFFSGVILNIVGVAKYLENKDDKLIPYSLMTISLFYMGCSLMLRSNQNENHDNYPVGIVINPSVEVIDNPHSVIFRNAPTGIVENSARM